jgi:exopolyphosphatase/pppGpp-phosphohydrolase
MMRELISSGRAIPAVHWAEMSPRNTPLSILTLAAATAIGASACGASAPHTSSASVQRCAVDMGSNTFRLIVASFHDGRYEQRRLEKRTLGVGDDIERHGRISEAKLGEIDAALAEFKTLCQKDGIDDVVAVGTAAFRDAPNGARAMTSATKRGIRMEIASEERESHLAYLVGSLGQDAHAVIDNGSRSIELVAQDGGSLSHVVVNLGYRLAYEQFFAHALNPEAAVVAFRDRLRREASAAPFMRGRKKLVGVEFAEMAEVLFDSAPVEGRTFTLMELKHRLHEIESMAGEPFEALKKRKDIDRALPRLVVAATLTEEFGYSELVLTGRELGSGLIIEAGLKNQ